MPFQCFQFRSYVIGTIRIPTLIQRYNSDVVTSDQEAIFFNIIQCKSKNAVQIFQKIRTFFPIKCQYYFTIRLGHKLVFPFKVFSYFAMVVYFTIHSQYQFAVFAEKWLTSGLRINDCQTFVSQDCIFRNIYARPVGSAMTNGFRHIQHLRTQGLSRLF